MKKHLSDPRSPGVYSLLIRSGIAERISRKHLSQEDARRFGDLLDSARTLYRAGLIDADAHDEAVLRIRRRRAAKVLSAYRSSERFGVRRKLIATLRKHVPLGVSAYDVRMGKVAI